MTARSIQSAVVTVRCVVAAQPVVTPEQYSSGRLLEPHRDLHKVLD
jgi:hypothetical protein